jgi:hypothetical protein
MTGVRAASVSSDPRMSGGDGSRFRSSPPASASVQRDSSSARRGESAPPPSLADTGAARAGARPRSPPLVKTIFCSMDTRLTYIVGRSSSAEGA